MGQAINSQTTKRPEMTQADDEVPKHGARESAFLRYASRTRGGPHRRRQRRRSPSGSSNQLVAAEAMRSATRRGGDYSWPSSSRPANQHDRGLRKLQLSQESGQRDGSACAKPSSRGLLVVCRGFGDPVEGGLSAGDFVEDLVGGFGPDEGLGVVVPVGDPAVDPGFEFGDGGEAGVGQGFAAEHGEPALDQVNANGEG